MYSRNSVIQRSTHGLGSLGVDARLALRALEVVAFRLGVLLDEDRRTARGAGLLHGPVPDGERACGIPAAPEERLPPPRAALHQLAGAAVGARHAESQRARALAFRIGRAGEELAETARADPHGTPANRARRGGHLRRLRFLFHRHGGLAFRITRACEERSVPPIPLHHLRSAFGALAVGLLRERGLEALPL